MTVKLHVGYVGKTREGKRVEIVEDYDDDGVWCYLGANNEWYKVDGSCGDKSIIGPWLDGPGPWIGWNGGECPVHPETVVDYVWFDKYDVTSGVTKSCKAGDHVAWSQVVKYRIIREHKEPPKPREFWIVGTYAYDKHPECTYDATHVREVLDT